MKLSNIEDLKLFDFDGKKIDLEIRLPLWKYIDYLLQIDTSAIDIEFKNEFGNWKFVVNAIQPFIGDVYKFTFDFGFFYDKRDDTGEIDRFYDDLNIAIGNKSFDRMDLIKVIGEILVKTIIEKNISVKSKLGKFIYSNYINAVIIGFNNDIFKMINVIKIGGSNIADEDFISKSATKKLVSIIGTGLIDRSNLLIKKVGSGDGLSCWNFKYGFIINFGNFEVDRQYGYVYICKDAQQKHLILKESQNSFILKTLEKIFVENNIEIEYENPSILIWENFIRISFNPSYFAEIREKSWKLMKYRRNKEVKISSGVYGDTELQNYEISKVEPLESIFFSQLPFFIDIIEIDSSPIIKFLIGRADKKEFTHTDQKLFEVLSNELFTNNIYYELVDFNREGFEKERLRKTISLQKKNKSIMTQIVYSLIEEKYVPMDYSYLIAEILNDSHLIHFIEVNHVISKMKYIYRGIFSYKWNNFDLPFELSVEYSLESPRIQINILDLSRNNVAIKNKKIEFRELKDLILEQKWDGNFRAMLENYINGSYRFDSTGTLLEFDVKILNVRCRDHNAEIVNLMYGKKIDKKVAICFKEQIDQSILDIEQYKIDKITIKINIGDKSIFSGELTIVNGVNPSLIYVMKPLNEKLLFAISSHSGITPPNYEYVVIDGLGYLKTSEYIIALEEDIRLSNLGIFLNQSLYDSINNYSVITDKDKTYLIGNGFDFGYGIITGISQDQILTKLKIFMDTNSSSDLEIGKNILINSQSGIFDTGEKVLRIKRTVEGQTQLFTKLVLLLKENENFYQISLRIKMKIGELKKNITLNMLDGERMLDQIKITFEELKPTTCWLVSSLNGVQSEIALNEYATYDITVSNNITRAQLIGIFPDTDELTDADIKIWDSMLNLDYKATVNIL